MNQSNFKHFFLITTFAFLLILLYATYNSYIPREVRLLSTNFSLFKIKKCYPIKDFSNQFKVKINGEYYPKSITLTRNQSIDFKCLNKNKIKRILFWNSFFRNEDYNFGIGKIKPFVKNRCPVVNCETTKDKSKLNKSHYVITHMRNTFENIPKYRLLNQKWIFFLLESPIHVGRFNNYDSIYNLTYTYKRSSNFPGSYEMLSRFYWAKNPSFNENFDFSKGKTDFLAAIISNCARSGPRLKYIFQLRNYVKVDLFGKCGRKCPIYFKNTKIKSDCKEIISQSYKFFLAIENSICNEYITEKFFDILKYNIIPVVMGGGNYEYYVSYMT